MVPIGWLGVAVNEAAASGYGQPAISTQSVIAIGLVVLYGWIMLDLWRSGRPK